MSCFLIGLAISVATLAALGRIELPSFEAAPAKPGQAGRFLRDSVASRDLNDVRPVLIPGPADLKEDASVSFWECRDLPMEIESIQRIEEYDLPDGGKGWRYVGVDSDQGMLPVPVLAEESQREFVLGAEAWGLTPPRPVSAAWEDLKFPASLPHFARVSSLPPNPHGLGFSPGKPFVWRKKAGKGR